MFDDQNVARMGIEDRRAVTRGLLDRRIKPRERTYLGAFAIFSDATSLERCIILNRSEKGAKLRFASDFVPDDFLLIDERAQSMFEVNVVWRSAGDYGVLYTRKLEPEQGNSQAQRARRILASLAGRQ